MNKRILILIILLLAVAVGIGLLTPILIHLYSVKVASEISADGILGYIVGYLSFITTGSLALYAIFQTSNSNNIAQKYNDIAQQYNDITNQLLDMENNNFQLKIRPFVTITKYEFKVYSQSEILNNSNKTFFVVDDWDGASNTYGLTLRITNTTESFLSFEFDKTQDENDNWHLSVAGENNIKSKKIFLMSGESQEIVLLADREFFLKQKSNRVLITILLENRFAEKYKMTIEMVFTLIYQDVYENKIIAYIYFQNYQISPADLNYNMKKLKEDNAKK